MQLSAPGTDSQLRRSSFALVVTGSLLLVTVFLHSNPWFGYDALAWPWEVLRQAKDPLRRANWVLWTLTGLWAVLLGFSNLQRLRAPVAVACALVLMVTCHSQQAEAPMHLHDHCQARFQKS